MRASFSSSWIILTSWHSIECVLCPPPTSSLTPRVYEIVEYMGEHAHMHPINSFNECRLAPIVAVIQNLNYTLWMNLLSESNEEEKRGGRHTQNSGKRIKATTTNSTWCVSMNASMSTAHMRNHHAINHRSNELHTISFIHMGPHLLFFPSLALFVALHFGADVSIGMNVWC